MHIPDALNASETTEAQRDLARALGNFSPWWHRCSGTAEASARLVVSRMPPMPFSDKEIDLLETFADQAVIAIQNARLFNETKEALDQQTAIGRSAAGDQQLGVRHRPVFERILSSAQRILRHELRQHRPNRRR